MNKTTRVRFTADISWGSFWRKDTETTAADTMHCIQTDGPYKQSDYCFERHQQTFIGESLTFEQGKASTTDSTNRIVIECDWRTSDPDIRDENDMGCSLECILRCEVESVLACIDPPLSSAIPIVHISAPVITYPEGS